MTTFLEKARPVNTSTPQAPSFLQKVRPVAGKTSGEFRYNQPVDRAQRMRGYQADAAASSSEAAKANSLGGLFKNTLKEAGSIIASGPVGLGKTLAGALRPVDKNLEASVAEGERIRTDTVKQIRENKAAGKDTSRLEKSFNTLSDTNNEASRGVITEQPSNVKAMGQVLGTGLDIISAGTYGSTANAGSKSFQMAPKVSTLPSAIQGLRATASKPAGLFTKKGASRVAGGTAIGYGYDVSQGMTGQRGEDREGIKALIPGIGTAIGFGLPAATEGVQSVKNVATGAGRANRTITKRATAVDDLARKYARVGTAFEAAEKKGVNVREVLSSTDLLNGAVDTDGMISADKALSNFDTMIAPYEGKVREAITKEGRRLSMQEMAAQADEFMTTTSLLGKDKITLENAILDELDAFTRDTQVVPLENFHDRKVQLGNRNNYLDPEKNVITKEVTRFFKELVEKNTKAIDAEQYNAGLSRLYSIRDVLESLDRTRVKGGRLGKYFASVVGGAAGGTVGGPLGVIFGAEAGAAAQGIHMSRALGGDVSGKLAPSKDMLAGLAAKATGKAAVPTVMLKKKPPGIPDLDLKNQSKSEGARNISQTTSATQPNMKTNPIADTVAPGSAAASKQGGQAFAGAAAGVEDTDGDGKIDNVDPLKAALGVVGMAGAQKIPKGITYKELGTLRDFVDMFHKAYKPDAKTLAALKKEVQELAAKYKFKAELKSDKALANEIGKILDAARFDETLK